MRTTNNLSARPSTSWGGKRRARPSTSWGARFAAVPALGLIALGTIGVTTATGTTAVPASTTSAAGLRAVIVTGPGAATALRSVGARAVRSAGYDPLAVGRVTDSQAAALRARGLHVAADAPATLDSMPTGTAQPSDGISATPDTTTGDAGPVQASSTGTDATAEDPAASDASNSDTPPSDITPSRFSGPAASAARSSASQDSGAKPKSAKVDSKGADKGKADKKSVGSAPRLSARDLVAGGWSGRGAGVTVAVIDSGVDEVPALAGRVVQGANFTHESAADSYGHGTFDAGLIAGNGTGARGETTPIIGVAPLARVVSVKVADAAGRSTIGQVALGLAWVIAHRAQYGINVVNLSMSTTAAMTYDVNPLNALAEAAWFSGVTVAVSSGNGGATTIRSAPANDPFVITVGSVYDHNTANRDDDTISPFTSLGRTIDGFRKPELLAPGQHLQSTLPTGSTLARSQTVSGLPVGYGQLSGTSMSTAVVSGLAGLLLEARPELSPDEVKGALVRSARHREAQLDSAARRAGKAKANVGVRPSMALAAAYAQLFAHTTDYSSVNWNAVDWRAVAWDQATWTNVDWTSATWSSATWSDATWGSASWASLTWGSASWSDASWSDASWSDASWSDASWSDASWSDASWSDASWSDATWTA